MIKFQGSGVDGGLSRNNGNGNGRVWQDDPVWTEGRVPHGYWDTRENRVAYMRWLGARLGFVKPDDWFSVSRRHFQQNNGGGLLKGKHNDSPRAAVTDFMPREPWYPWLFNRTPNDFWQDIRNRRAFIDWFEVRMGIESKEDWYGVRKRDVVALGGGGMLANYYNDSVLGALRELRSRKRWQEWRFHSVPQKFWLSADNLHRYMDWLGKQLRIHTPELWYGVSAEDVQQHHGSTPLAMHGGSVYKLVSAYLPQFDWKPWLFSSTPDGFWHCLENRRAYLCWLGVELGFRRPTDWYGLRSRHFRGTGAVLYNLHYGYSTLRAARERYPNYRWNTNRFPNSASAS